jgi:adenylate kinase family enzyme
MDRVLIVGCSGAGKTAFALRLGARTGLPVVHLDREFWRPGWTEPSMAVWRHHVEELAAQPRWIMDGEFRNSLDLRLPRADTVIFLDMPRWLSLMRVARRTGRHFGRTRIDMAPGCTERFDWAFMKYIWRYQRKVRPRLCVKLQEFGGSLIVLRSPAEAEAYLAQLGGFVAGTMSARSAPDQCSRLLPRTSD